MRKLCLPLLALLLLAPRNLLEPHTGSWINLGKQGYHLWQNVEEFEVGSQPLCYKVPGLTPGQMKLCQLYQDHMGHIGRGAKAGIEECQWQFRYRRWNCSTVNDSTVFGPLFDIPGVVHVISRSCRDGILSTCGCSEAKAPKNLHRDWNWGGCGDNLEYGYRFAQQFVDVREREKRYRQGSRKHGRSLMNLHNNEAGRRAVIKTSKVTCKCHGVSGSCSLVTCWNQLRPFREIGDLLKRKYDSAIIMKMTKKGNLYVKERGINMPSPNDLIYLKESPNYCTRNKSTGIFGNSKAPLCIGKGLLSGTKGRECNRTSEGVDGCGLLCCGRGYNSKKYTTRARCHCKFRWCCNVECKSCMQLVERHTCK